MNASTTPSRTSDVQDAALYALPMDDRHYCRDCYHLHPSGNCNMAAIGKLPGLPAASRWYLPVQNVPMRCPVFCALPHQRP